jgi:type IV pilus assembly protein PilC
MPVFSYQGTNRAGAAVQGERSAASRSELIALLRRESVQVSRVSRKSKALRLPSLGGKVTAKDLAVFSRQFSVMIDAGLPLVQCLEILATQQQNPAFRKVLADVRATVEGGATLSAAMRRHDKVFDSLFTNMVEAGEAGGILDKILQRLSSYLEKNAKLKRAVQSAMIYPSSVMGIAAAVIALLLWKVVPIFVTLFNGLGAALPLPTRIVIAISRFVGSIYGLLIVVLVVGGVIAVRLWYKTPQGRLAIDGLVLRIPLLGAVLRKIAVARFTRTLGTLISSGVPILEGLEITARSSGNAVLERAILQTRGAVESGRALVEPLKETKVFPHMVTQMIAVGEQTGQMDAMLQKVADFFEEDVDAAVKDLLTALEPAMIVVLGLVVGGIVVSMYLPLFSLIGQLSGGH